MSDWLFIILTLAVGAILGAVAGYARGYHVGYLHAEQIAYEWLRELEREKNRDD